MTITEFLLDRIAEDETEARYAATDLDNDQTAHWIREVYAPRVAADAKAKRQIAELAVEDGAWGDGHTHAVRCLAEVYAGHADYDEVWRP